MSDITKQELTDILDAREEKTLTTIRLILEKSLEKIQSEFKIAMLKMDNTIDRQIKENEKDIETMKHDCVVCRDNVDRGVADIAKKTSDQEDRIRKLEKWFWGASGVISVAVVIVGVMK